MANYKKMYLTLANKATNIIDSLIIALEKAEGIYIDTDDGAEETERQRGTESSAAL